MIVVTGGAGFIGSCYVWKLNQEGVTDIIVVDELGSDEKWKNLQGKKFLDYCEKDEFLHLLDAGKIHGITEICHMGACSATTETNASYLVQNNYEYSKKVAEYAFKNDCYFSYASSAATYGDGAQRYSDDEATIDRLRPLNMYGYSKQLFDLWLARKGLWNKVVGYKFFNVFGPNEYHKGTMRSLVCKAYEQIKATGKLKLFKSYKPEYAHGEQKRDFVYVKDVVAIMYRVAQNRKVRGLFNIGAEKAQTWNELGHAIFDAMGKKPAIEYIDMPDEIREKYQYFTQSDMSKLKRCGIDCGCLPLAQSVKDYVQYLAREDRYL